jgi:hypothetical protein
VAAVEIQNSKAKPKKPLFILTEEEAKAYVPNEVAHRPLRLGNQCAAKHHLGSM